VRDAELSAEARLARLERKLRSDLRYFGYPARPDCALEELLARWTHAMGDIMRPRGRR
jgi:hypothetical protein